MAVATLPYTYRYARPSSVTADKTTPRVEMSASAMGDGYPYFFQGQLVNPWISAQALRVLSKVVGSRFHLPAMMLRRILAEADPVVTSGGGFLRFEGFSGCCSTYARVDMTPDAYRGVVAGEGTTNVDFNAPFRAALAQIRDGECMGLAVGRDEVALLRNHEQFVERKVALPFRWLKSFCEIQAFQSRMVLRFDLRRAEALAFVRSLPASVPGRAAFWVVPAGRGVRLSQRETPDGVRISGIERLRLLQDLAPLCDGLQIYADPAGDASEWIVRLGPLRLCLTISAEVWRGFSGEGQVLHGLAQTPDEALLNRLHGMLKWQADLRAPEFAANWDVSEAAVHSAMAVLASRGLAGFDLSLGAHFHRVLPFDLELVETMHPRLKQARALVADGGVKWETLSDGELKAEVRGSGVWHQVTVQTDTCHCTCPWHAKHQNSRGPCKHILAAKIAAGQSEDDEDHTNT